MPRITIKKTLKNKAPWWLDTAPGTQTMAKQLGIFPIGGSLDNVTFFHTADGLFGVRKKSKLTGELMATMPAFDRLREHNREFGNAGRAIKLIRAAAKPLITNTADRKSTERLQRVLFESVKRDTTSPRGQRTPQSGDLSLLKGFDFNEAAKLDALLAAPFTTSIDRNTGKLSLSIPAFNPKVLLTAPPSATHFRIFLGAAGIDFTTEETESNMAESADLPITNALSLLKLTAHLSPSTSKVILVLIGIRFYEEIHSTKYPLHGNNTLTIVNLDQ